MKVYKVKVNGKVYEVELESVTESSAKIETKAPATPSAASVETGSAEVKAPMAGSIIDVKVAVGQKVGKGDVLVVLEAMKLENDIVAPVGGTITNVLVSKGQSVSSGQKIILIG